MLTVNAKQIFEQNSVVITLGIAEDCGITADSSKEDLYGTIGAVMAHEMSHGFDDNGVNYDKDGMPVTWISDEDAKIFDENVKKVESYYDGISPFEGYNCDGEVVSSEAVADMTGMQAILKHAAKEKDFDYEKFFKAYAYYNKYMSSYEDDIYCISSDPHPLNYLRVNVASQQFDEFNDTFDVKEGDGMYLAPENRILVW